MNLNTFPVKNELSALTGIRGLAALWVVGHHFYDEWVILIPALHWCKPFLAKGNYAVDFFFMLSGFILCHAQNLRGNSFGIKEYFIFLRLRIARIYPNHLAILVVLIGMVVIAGLKGIKVEGDYPISGLPFQLTMTHAFPWVSAGAWNYPAWSISAEWFAYLLIFPLAWRMTKVNLRPELAAILTVSGMLIWCGAATALKDYENGSACLRVSCGFLCGALAYTIFRAKAGFLKWVRSGVDLLVITLVLIFFIPLNDFLIQTAILCIIFPLVLLGLTQQNSAFSKFLSRPELVWLGNISYAIYISHAIVEKILKIAASPERYQMSSLGARMGILAINILCIFLTAIVLYYVVEIPGRKWLRQKL